MNAARSIVVIVVLGLAGCSADSGFLTGGTTAEWWAKCYKADGMASAGGGGVGAQAQMLGELDSIGLVGRGTIDPEVLEKLIDRCPKGDTEEVTGG